MVVGREAELAAIDRVIQAAGRHEGGVLLLAGEPGSGKSTLLEYARSKATGLTLLRSDGVASESSLAFSGLAELLRPVLGHLDQIPELQAASLRAALALGPPTASDRFVTYMAGFNLIAAAAAVQPVLITVDDAHWLDASSGEALFFACRRLSEEAVAAIVTMRPEIDLPTDPVGLPRYQLMPLTTADSLFILERHPRPMSRDVAQALCSAAAGNALALEELPFVLSDAQLMGLEPLPNPLPVGSRLMRAFEPRLRQLPPSTRTVLLLSSAMDAGSLSILSRATGQLGIDCEAAITPAEDAGLVTVTDAVRFRHPLIRSTVYAGASPKDRRQAHRVIASVLPVAATAERAMHRAAATIGPDDAIANDLEAIGQQEQARGGYQSASAIFGRAAALSSRTEDEVRRLTSAAMTAQLGGRSARAVECLDRALALTEEPLTHADLTLLRHTISQWLEHPIAAYEALTREASVIKSRDIGRAARLLTNAVYPCCMAAELVKAVETATQARELAQASGDHLLITGAIAVESIAHLLHGDGFRNAEPLKAALSAFLDPDLGTTIPVEVWNGAYAMFVAEDYRIARKLLTKAIQQNRAAGALVTLPYPLALLSEIEFRTGAWLEAYADASESVLLALETAQDSSRAYGLVCLARVEAATARDNVCAGHLAEALELAERFGTGSIPTYVWSIEGFKAVTNQQWQAAITALDALRRRCRQIEQREPNILRWQADLIEAYVRVGDVERAAAVINELTADVERTRGRWGYAAVARSRALLAMNEGEATSLFSQAIDLEADDPFEEARTHLLLGEWLRRAKRGVSAREHLHSALDAFERLGASTWATRTRRELMASGERIGRRRGPAVEALSPAELQVCRAVASGETNKEVAANLFISLKTVETHLTNAYAKLGLRSRSELARLFALEPERAVMPVA